MADFRLPRLQSTQPIVDGQQRPTTTFQRFWQSAVEQIEGVINNIVSVNDAQDALLVQIQAALAAAQAAQVAAQTAQKTANTTGSGGSGEQIQGNSGSLDVLGTAWSPGPVVSFPAAVAVTHETFPGCDLAGGVVSGVGSFSGEARIVRAIGGVQTEVQVVTFTATYLAGDYYEPSETSIVFSGFSFDAAESTTGLIDYRMDLRRASGSTTLTGVTATIQVKRTP